MNIAIAAGTYQCCKERFEIREYLMQRIGCRQQIQIRIADDVPNALMTDRSLFVSLIRNLINNAETHGETGGILLVVVEMSGSGMNIIITNRAGDNHNKCLELQAINGKNFLMDMHKELIASTQQIGSADSTFLGMREISDSARLLESRVNIVFEESTVITLLNMLNVEITQAIKLKKKVEQDAMPADVVFVCCDDDKVCACWHLICVCAIDVIVCQGTA